GSPVAPDVAQLKASLQELLAELDRLYATTHPREVLPGFSPLLTGQRSLDERLLSLPRLFSPVWKGSGTAGHR
ncbi:MAG: hypothetical protein ACK42E_03125, partial [Candidatus Bipolaricaulaceae bacterium]